MNFLPVPKILKWPRNLTQRYESDRQVLLTSGCSFTSSTLRIDCAASWPGFVRDRCGFDFCIDMSFPGNGNLYIHDSIMYALDHVIEDQTKCLVLVMWSGLDRFDKIILDDIADDSMPNLGGQAYKRQLKNPDIRSTTRMSMEKMAQLAAELDSRKIPYAFSTYCNLLWPPFIPNLDTKSRFPHHVTPTEVKALKTLPWTVTYNDCLYEWAFINDYLNSGDYFHPPVEANLRWTDEIFLPALMKQNLIRSLRKQPL